MNIIFIGAHFDDIELSAGGTVAKFIQQGHNVYAIVVTSSDYTSYDGKILRNQKESIEEGLNGLLTLGIKKENIYNLGFETKKVPFGAELIEKINKIIDAKKINLIITHHPYAESHPDHINTSKSTLAAGRRYNAIWCYEPFYPSKLSTMPFRPMKYIDISEYMNLKIKSLKAHKSQWKKYGYWKDLILSIGRLRGIELQTKYAEAFEIIKDNL